MAIKINLPPNIKNVVANGLKPILGLASKLPFFPKKEEKIEKLGIVGVSFNVDNIQLAYVIGEDVNNLNILILAEKSATTWDEKKVALKEIVQEYSLQEQKCNVILNNIDYKLTMVDKPQVEEDDMEGAIAHAISDYLEYDIFEASISHIPIPFKRTKDNKEILYVATIKIDLMNQIEDCIKNSGLEIDAIDIQELSYRNLIKLDVEAQKSYMVIISNKSKSDAFVYNNADLIMTRKVTSHLAKFSKENPAEVDLNSDDEALDEFTLNIQRSIDYCNGVFRDYPIEKIIFISPDLKLDDVSKYVAKQLGIPTHIYSLENSINMSDEVLKSNFANYFAVIGTAIRDFNYDDIEIKPRENKDNNLSEDNEETLNLNDEEQSSEQLEINSSQNLTDETSIDSESLSNIDNLIDSKDDKEFSKAEINDNLKIKQEAEPEIKLDDEDIKFDFSENPSEPEVSEEKSESEKPEAEKSLEKESSEDKPIETLEIKQEVEPEIKLDDEDIKFDFSDKPSEPEVSEEKPESKKPAAEKSLEKESSEDKPVENLEIKQEEPEIKLDDEDIKFDFSENPSEPEVSEEKPESEKPAAEKSLEKESSEDKPVENLEIKQEEPEIKLDDEDIKFNFDEKPSIAFETENKEEKLDENIDIKSFDISDDDIKFDFDEKPKINLEDDLDNKKNKSDKKNSDEDLTFDLDNDDPSGGNDAKN